MPHRGDRPLQLLLLTPGRAVRQAADVELAARIRTIHRASDGTYGVPRITAELHEDGERVNHKRVARVMRTIGLAGLRLRRKLHTTIPDPAAAKVPDLIGRNSTADEVNTKYVGDITYLPLPGGKFRYLATSDLTLAGWTPACRAGGDGERDRRLLLRSLALRVPKHCKPKGGLGCRRYVGGCHLAVAGTGGGAAHLRV
ncbi:IS3 family transposase [Streptomyces griseofuscus]|uniref:IS3 family transposase n=1 Tax=Streptomyces griseofuscus TaxID=146922 RepID=UPI00343C301C